MPCDSFDRKLQGLTKQLEDMFEQMAELDARGGKVDISPFESRLQKMESNWQDLNSLRGLRKEVQDRLEDVDRNASKSRSRLDNLEENIEGIKGRVGMVESSLDPLRPLSNKLDSLAQDTKNRTEDLAARIDKNAREAETRFTNIERETLPTRVRQLEERLTSQDSTQRVTGMASRLDLLERDSQEVRKEVSWLRDRPMGLRFDQFAHSRLGRRGGQHHSNLPLLMARFNGNRATIHSRRPQQAPSWRMGESRCRSIPRTQGSSEPAPFSTTTPTGSQLTLADENGTERTRLVAEPTAGAGLSLPTPRANDGFGAASKAFQY